MVRELLIAPAIIVIVLSFTIALADVAQSTSNKALLYADQMDNAVDCAFQGRAIDECSPTLTDTEFRTNAVAYKEMNEEYIQQLKDALTQALNETNSTNSTSA